MNISFKAIGTHWVIDVYDVLSAEKEENLTKKIKDRIEQFEQMYSRFRENSWLQIISKNPSTYGIPSDGEVLISLYKNMYQYTAGAVTPLIGQVLVDAGYDKEYSLIQKKELSSPPLWEDVIEFNPPHITIKKECSLDFGAFGKGYCVDIVDTVLKSEGVNSFCVDAGGDMIHKSTEAKALRVGLEDPLDTKNVIGLISLLNKSIAGSSGNRRAWGKFNHIINPKTLESSKDIQAIWVVADSTLIADAMTTALYFTSPEILLKHFSFEYLMLFSDYSVAGTLLIDAE